MTLSEFKAWFEGFTEDLDGAPSEKQWDRIKSRVGEITGHAVSYPVYIDRYVRALYPHWLPYGAASSPCLGIAQGVSLNAVGASAVVGSPLNAGAFDSHSAMGALGRADAASLRVA